MRKTLGGKVISGLGWAFGSSIGIRLAQFISMIVLARMLLPAHFGLFALSSMVVTAITLFRDYGFGEYLLYLKKDLKSHADTVFIMSMAFGIAAWGITYAAAPLAVRIFGTANLVWPLRVMSISVIVSSFAVVPAAVLERELEFRKRTMPEMAMGVSNTVISIVLAALGCGVWSLVVGHVVSTAVSAAWTWQLAGWKPSFSFSSDDARRIVVFGKPLMASSLLILVFFYADQAAIGRWISVAAVGYYSMSFSFCHLPATDITFTVNRVMYPAYTRLSENIVSLRKAYMQAVRGISLISVPLAFWMCFLAEDIVLGFLGEKWLLAVPLVRILAFYGMFRSIATTAASVFMAVGEPKWSYRVSCIQTAIALPLAYPAAINYGAVGVAVLFTLAYSIGGIIALIKVSHLLEFPPSKMVELLGFPVLASGIIVSAAFGISRLFAPGIFAVITSTAITLILYVLAVLLFDKESVNTIRWAFSVKTVNREQGTGNRKGFQ
ncbi:MAG: lipopolysaccharide biosynthesis protein [Armatimonadota bacterium]